MNSLLCISVHFLDPTFHGRRDGGEPEWPPSPLRLYQAIVDAASERWRNTDFAEFANPVLRWLENSDRPTLVAPAYAIGNPYRIAVPNNDLDVVASAWSKGSVSKKQPNALKTMKPMLPIHLLGSEECFNTVFYLIPLPDNHCPHFDILRQAARSITHLGWGIDMVAGDASIISEAEAQALPGERWRPTADGSGNALRVPIEGTLDALMKKHEAFLQRLGPDGFKPVPPLSTFRVVGYRRATDVASRPFASFEILKPDASGRRSFDTARRARDVAAWVRNATGEVCRGWPDLKSFVHGHGDDNLQLKGASADRRFMYLPLPTINHALNRVESIRRVLVVAPAGCREKVGWIRRRLPGQELTDDDRNVMGVLNLLPTDDWVLKQYVRSAQTWSTVTPVLLPGYDDRNSRKAESLLRKAFIQAGLSAELVEKIELLEWRGVGFRAGLDLAARYARPRNLNGSPYHVRVRFPHPISGPLAVGAGRYRGLGLFAACED